MLCFTNSKFFSLPYKLQQTSHFRGNLRAASNSFTNPRVNHDIPACE